MIELARLDIYLLDEGLDELNFQLNKLKQTKVLINLNSPITSSNYFPQKKN